MITVPMKVAASRVAIPVTISASGAQLNMVVVAAYQSVDAPRYDGDYTFTPTAETQMIDISGKMATANIMINPIPSNYGRIEYNGSFLTII